MVERVVPPTTVMALANISPSASTRNLAEPLTESDNKLESAAAEEGLIIKLAPKGLAPDTPVLQEPKVCTKVGAKLETNFPLKVLVAVVLVTVKEVKVEVPAVRVPEMVALPEKSPVVPEKDEVVMVAPMMEALVTL